MVLYVDQKVNIELKIIIPSWELMGYISNLGHAIIILLAKKPGKNVLPFHGKALTYIGQGSCTV